MDLDLTISESEDLDLEEENSDLPPWDLTTSLLLTGAYTTVYGLHPTVAISQRR